MVTVLEDVALRVDGMRVLERLHRSADGVVLDLQACSLRDALWALPALEAIAADLAGPRIAVVAADRVADLAVTHLRSLGHDAARLDTRPPASQALRIELSPRPSSRPRLSPAGDRLRIPSRPFPKRVQHAWGHWVDGARACGFDARAVRPRLRLDDPPAARSARLWLRERFGRRGRTLIALLPAPVVTGDPGPATRTAAWGADRFAFVGRELGRRLDAAVVSWGASIEGALPLEALPIVAVAHVLSVAAVAIGDAEGLVHLAAAAGAPAVSVHGDASGEEVGAASELGAALWPVVCRCAAPRSHCLDCVPRERVVEVAEPLAGQRWPWDRLAQLGLAPLSLPWRDRTSRARARS